MALLKKPQLSTRTTRNWRKCKLFRPSLLRDILRRLNFACCRCVHCWCQVTFLNSVMCRRGCGTQSDLTVSTQRRCSDLATSYATEERSSIPNNGKIFLSSAQSTDNSDSHSICSSTDIGGGGGGVVFGLVGGGRGPVAWKLPLTTIKPRV
jgi:hypothetical protein